MLDMLQRRIVAVDGNENRVFRRNGTLRRAAFQS